MLFCWLEFDVVYSQVINFKSLCDSEINARAATISCMSDPLSERRMAENEVVFRNYNEGIQKGFDEAKKYAKEDGQEDLISEEDLPLLFYCECSDENCTIRVSLKLSRYSEIHKARDRFVIASGHETLAIERIISKEADFYIVEKFTVPPEGVTELKPTDLDNS